jgi:hypothetical protein
VRNLRTVSFSLAFIVSVMGAWAWFNVLQPPAPGLPEIVAATNVPGFKFDLTTLPQTAIAILETPEYINGTFYQSAHDGNPSMVEAGFRVFAANWSPRRLLGLGVVQHTPDICWVGAGWLPVDLGQPEQVELELLALVADGRRNAPRSLKVPFECRAFRSPDGRSKELVMWCTLVGGHVLPESSRFRASKTAVSAHPAENDQERQFAAGRRLSADYFVQAVRKRLRAQGAKQFFRLSASVDGDCTRTLKSLKEFGLQWLAIESRLR